MYKITLTARGGLTTENIDVLVNYFTKRCTHAYLVNEFGESGENSHLEGVIEILKTKTSNLTRSIANVYFGMDLEVIPRITICVKTCVALAGALSYSSKELRDKGNVVLLLGWEDSWIQQKVKSVARVRAPNTLMKMGTWLGKRLAPAKIYTWCKANNCEVKDLRSYREVCVKMGDEKYMFDRGIHKCTYANVMALFGDGRGIGKIIDDECRFLQ